MATPIKNVIIAGAGGNLGSVAITAFLKSNLNVSVLSREDSKATFPEGVKVIKASYTKESLVPALKGQDAVISFVSSSAAGDDGQVALVEAAVEAGVSRYIPSEFGHNTNNDKVRAIVPLFNSKRKIVELLKTKESQLSWTGIVTGLFFDWGFKAGFTGFDVPNAKATIWDEGDIPLSTTNLPLIGATIVKLLTDPAAYEDSKNKYIYTASHTLTQKQVLAAVEKATGKTFEVTKVNGQEQVKENQAKLAKGDFSGVLQLLKAVAFVKIDGEDLADFRPYGIFNEKYGVKDVSLDDDVKGLVAN